jgi:hypothetical protein
MEMTLPLEPNVKTSWSLKIVQGTYEIFLVPEKSGSACQELSLCWASVVCATTVRQ